MVLDEVFPGVLKVHPNTKLYIVGKNPPEKFIDIKNNMQKI